MTMTSRSKTDAPDPGSPIAQVQKAAARTSCICPECGHVFRGSGWDGIDAHWKAKHDKVVPYEEAWPLIKAGTYALPTQAEKFAQAARDLGADQDEDAFKGLLRKLTEPKDETN